MKYVKTITNTIHRSMAEAVEIATRELSNAAKLCPFVRIEVTALAETGYVTIIESGKKLPGFELEKDAYDYK